MKFDPVNHPKHYTFGKYEVIDVLEDWFDKDPLLWQVGKYIARAGRKGNEVEDLEKAKWYLERRIARAKEKVTQGSGHAGASGGGDGKDSGSIGTLSAEDYQRILGGTKYQPIETWGGWRGR